MCEKLVALPFSDGLRQPEEIIDAYRNQGFSCVAITDHGFMVPPNYWNYLELLSRKLKNEMMILPGIERDYEPWNSHHLLEIAGIKQKLRILCHPRAYFLTIEQVNQRIQNAPFPIDAVEVSYRGFYTPEYNVNQIKAPKIATDDSHEICDIARGWIETDNFADPDKLIRAIRRGDFEIKVA